MCYDKAREALRHEGYQLRQCYPAAGVPCTSRCMHEQAWQNFSRQGNVRQSKGHLNELYIYASI
jgi:hypothetical protein